MSRELKLSVMRQWVAAVTEAQREKRAYSWHQCFKLLEPRA